MRALTLKQPWAGLVASGVKLIENRGQKPPEAMIGQPFAIHASRATKDSDRWSPVYERIYRSAPELATVPRASTAWATSAPWIELAQISSALIGVATITHVFHGGWDQATIAEHRDSLAETIRIHTDKHDQVRWFFGPVGYVLRDVRALAAPVPCKGALGFWRLTDELERAVMEQLR